MTDFDPDDFLEQTGFNVRLARPVVEPALSSAGEQAQAQLLRCFGSV